MAFLTGLLLIDAPASALNNAGRPEDARTANPTAIQFIRTRPGHLPYLSTPAVPYPPPNNPEQTPELNWRSAPVRKESENLAYTDGNPIEWWDDDLFGYMRAPGDQEGRKWATPISAAQKGRKPVITRVSPFRVSTLISLAPVISIPSDYGSMTRGHEGDPVLHEHQFCRAVLKGLVSLNLRDAGTFSYADRTGYRNLDDNRVELAKKRQLEHLNGNEKSYRLPREQRVERVVALLRALGVICGGAKLALHYTDVTPVVFVGMITKGGNNPLQYLIGSDDKGQPRVNADAVQQSLAAWRDQILSKLYVGWVQGFCDAEMAGFQNELKKFNEGKEPERSLPVEFGHPRNILEQMANDLSDQSNAEWLG